MIHDVISAEYVDGHRINVSFENGKSGIVDFQELIAKGGGVFRKLEDLDFFLKFEINREWGVITWGEEVDVAPETLYALATGEPLPQWIRSESSIKENV